MASQTEPTRFSLGLTYWPRRTGFGWWRAYDRGETREELAHVASLGCDTVRFCLRWEDFQPSPQRINSGALNALEHALDVAHEAGLAVVAALFPVAIGGALQVPEWANRVDVLGELGATARVVGPTIVLRPSGGPRLLYEGAYHANQARDLFGAAPMLDAQRYLIREVAGYFRSHPALTAWQLGDGLERVRKPQSAQAVAEWYAAMAEALREQDSKNRILGVTSARGLTQSSGPRPEHIAASCGLVGVAADPPQTPEPARPNHAAYVAYVHGLAASLSRRSVIVTSLGLPTAVDNRAGWIGDRAYGRQIQAYLGDHEQQSRFLEDALGQLQRAGAQGAWLASYADYAPALWQTPPFDRAIRERTLGIVDADGREKPAAGTLRAFAARRPTVADVASSIEADPESYWRNPQREFVRLWREFTSD